MLFYLPFTQSHILTLIHIHSSSGMVDATIFYCYICRDSCVKHSHLCCSSWACVLSASNVGIPHVWSLLVSSYIHAVNCTSVWFSKKYFKITISVAYSCEKPYAHYGTNTSSMKVCEEQMYYNTEWANYMTLFQRGFSNSWVCNVVLHTKEYIWNIAHFFIVHFLNYLSFGWMLMNGYCLFLFTGSC